MKLTAVFESWLVPDGDYPPLRRQQPVSLSFEMRTENLSLGARDLEDCLENLRGAEYRFVGTVLGVYKRGIDRDAPIVAVESRGVRFYISVWPGFKSTKRGSKVLGEGTLFVDSYAWIQFVHLRRRPPNLLHDFRVARILMVQLPASLIVRHDTGKPASWPTHVGPEKYSTQDIVEVETMEGQPFETEFYLLELDDAGLGGMEVPRTFIG